MNVNDARRHYLKALPRVDQVLVLLEDTAEKEELPRQVLVDACRFAVEVLRKRILEADAGTFEQPTPETARDIALDRIRTLKTPGLRRVVNATGIILHTNLGRAPLCEEALQAIIAVSRGYSNLEFNLHEGRRGLRYDHVRELLSMLTGAEESIVVNNNAAAVLLVLNTLSAGKEAVVSRGELIEIGGEFRIPEVMAKSGARLREVGTTNRTRIADYEEAVDQEKTGLILKVHTSNFRTIGFTEEVPAPALVELGRRRGVPVMHDLGSGCLVDLGIGDEPTVRDAVQWGSDVVTFSGDKLLGGPQAGIILGRRSVVETIRKNPLNRALRIDKLTLAALEATLRNYLLATNVTERIPALRAMTEPVDAVRDRAEQLLGRIEKAVGDSFSFTLVNGASLSGGGALPTREISTVLIAVTARNLTAQALERRLRAADPPVIARIADDQVLLDSRTLQNSDADDVVAAFRRVAAAGPA